MISHTEPSLYQIDGLNYRDYMAHSIVATSLNDER
jgi:hypothetical protein